MFKKLTGSQEKRNREMIIRGIKQKMNNKMEKKK